MINKIRVRDYLNNPIAVSIDKAEIIFNECKLTIQEGKIIEIDFDDIKLVITAFLNIAIGKLYGLDIDYNIIDEKLRVINASPSIEKMIEKVKINSKKFYSNRINGKKNNDYLNRSIDGDI